MNGILKAIREKRMYFDGGYGTVFQKQGLNPGEPPESFNLSAPEKVINLHRAYIEAGSNFITTNTFGISPAKYENYAEMAAAAVGLARRAAEGRKEVYVAFDMGPTGGLLQPFGDIPFERAVNDYRRLARAGAEAGADLIIIETISDCYETKAALLGAKEGCDLPVFVTNAYGRAGKLMTGADPAGMIAMLESMGADAVGMNCSFGPDLMLEAADRFLEAASVPVIINPNAGLPRVIGGSTEYDISAEEFADYMAKLASKGVHILGGCCGTTPEYIRRTVERTADIPFIRPSKKDDTVISSYSRTVNLNGGPVIIGERINPTGKPAMKQALKTGDFDYILNEGLNQADGGAHILDVNVGVPGTDEAENMLKAVTALQEVTNLPLQIDSSDVRALECAMRAYSGKPLINSVNGKKESMERVFPLVKKYGGAVIALTMDEAGIPATAEGRVEIAERIIKCAEEYGIDKKDIIADPLCLAVSAEPLAAEVTLRAIRLLKARGIRTSLGISNVSFGLPAREKINAAFFAAALENGLDCAIINPFSAPVTDVYYAYRALHGKDVTCADYISYVTGKDSGERESAGADSLEQAVIKGLKEAAQKKAEELLSGLPPLEVINGHIIPALTEVGRQFADKRIYLPQLLMSAEAAVAAVNAAKKHFAPGAADRSKKVILATVKGDIHDIGKNIVKVLLESHGFTVYDLGKDVPPEKVLEKVNETGCRLVGLSALMTTTVPAMEETIALLRERAEGVTVIVGGAVLTEDYAQNIGADAYCEDAMATVRFAQRYYGEKE